MNKEPIFKIIFGSQWKNLPPVLQKRYTNRPYSNDEVIVEGLLDVHVSKWMRFLSPLLRFCGALVPYKGRNIPVTVCFNSYIDSKDVGFNRTFNFHNRKPFEFRSQLEPMGGDKVIEFMRYGLGWRMRYHYDGKKVKLDDDGYIWRIGKLSIPLPLQLILGRAYAYEKAVSDNEFAMYFEITHPFFGKIFGYEGKFKVVKVPQ